MTELERQLMKALKEWGEQYEQGQKQQAAQVESLTRQVSSLARQYEREQQEHAERVEALTAQVEALASDYRDLATLLKGL